MSDPATVVLGARNQQLKRLRKLVRQAKVRSDERAFVVDGPTLVADALASSLTVEAVFVGAESSDLLPPDLSPDRSVTVYAVDDEILTSVLDPANPRPVAAVVEAPHHSLSDVAVHQPLLVAVELRDPGNLGTLIRTAEAAGFGALVVAGQTVDHLNPKVVRASAGSVLRLPVIVFDDLDRAWAAISATGRILVATAVTGDAVPYDQTDLTSAAIIVGNEPHGLADTVIERADQVVNIPMADGVESLNVAAAGAVLAFESARQRRRKQETAPRLAADETAR